MESTPNPSNLMPTPAQQAVVTADTPWCQREVNALFEAQSVDPSVGLCPDEGAHRLAIAGANVLPGQSRRGVVTLLLAQFSDFMV